jgi:hypothetical protein
VYKESFSSYRLRWIVFEQARKLERMVEEISRDGWRFGRSASGFFGEANPFKRQVNQASGAGHVSQGL